MPTITKLGKYLIRRTLGKGAMGVVYEGFDPVLARTVAIKTILPAQLDGSEVASVLARFKREAQAAGRLNHPGIVAVYEYGEVDAEYDPTVMGNSGYSPLETERVAFIAMQFVKGRELRSYFEENERFALKDAARIMEQILDALDHAHSNGVTHRDIKPANLIMLDDGRVKIADFGIARIESSQLTVAGTVMGTPSYMSPEQFQGQTVDLRSDLFSCGVILYQFLTGEKPFVGTLTSIMFKVLREQPVPPSALNAALVPAWDRVVEKAIAKNPEDRFQSAQAFAAAIRSVLAGEPSQLPPVNSSKVPLATDIGGPVTPLSAPTLATAATAATANANENVSVPVPVLAAAAVQPDAPVIDAERTFLTQADVSKAIARQRKEAEAAKQLRTAAIPKATGVPKVPEIPKTLKIPEAPPVRGPDGPRKSSLWLWLAAALLLLAGAGAYLGFGSGNNVALPSADSRPSAEKPGPPVTAPLAAPPSTVSVPSAPSAAPALPVARPPATVPSLGTPAPKPTAPLPVPAPAPMPVPVPVPMPVSPAVPKPAAAPTIAPPLAVQNLPAASEPVKRPGRKPVVALPAPARPAETAPAKERPTAERAPQRPARCALILQKAAVSEPISAEERNFLTSSCQ